MRPSTVMIAILTIGAVAAGSWLVLAPGPAGAPQAARSHASDFFKPCGTPQPPTRAPRALEIHSSPSPNRSWFDGPVNGDLFRAWVEQALVPTLKPSDIVVADNLGSHKGKAVRQAIRAAGAHLMFLPKYSPDLNPIEQIFAKLKTRLRKAGARSLDAVGNAIAHILTTYTPAECARYLTTAGYAST